MIADEDISTDPSTIRDQREAEAAGIELKETRLDSKKVSSKAPKKGSRSFPSRTQYVGGMYCLFLSSFRKGRFPICSIGPSWCFTVGLLGFAAMCGCFMGFMIAMFRKSPHLQWIASCGVLLNVLLLFGGICGDPGVKKETYLHHTKAWFSEGKEVFTQDSDDEHASGEEEGDDIEQSPSNSLQKRRDYRKQSLEKAINSRYYQPQWEHREGKNGEKIKVMYCVKCNVDVEDDMEHCEDCDVCVYDYDHHCVFFSKCIGGGNIWCFGGSIGMLVFNFILIFVFLIIDGDPEARQQLIQANAGLHKKRKHQMAEHQQKLNMTSSTNEDTLNVQSLQQPVQSEKDNKEEKEASIDIINDELQQHKSEEKEEVLDSESEKDDKPVSRRRKSRQDLQREKQRQEQVAKIDGKLLEANIDQSKKVEDRSNETIPGNKDAQLIKEDQQKDNIKVLENSVKEKAVDSKGPKLSTPESITNETLGLPIVAETAVAVSQPQEAAPVEKSEPKQELSPQAKMEAKIQDLISKNKVMVFSKSYCPFSKMTKALLLKKKVQFVAYELDTEPDGQLMHTILKQISGYRTVPNVYINKKHIGGNDQIQQLERSGKLDQLLQDNK